MDLNHVRFDFRSQFTVFCLVFGNDVPISTADTPQNDSRGLRHCAFRHSYVVVHFFAAKGDWLLRVRDLDSHFVLDDAEMAADRKRTVAWDGGEKWGQTPVAERDVNSLGGLPFRGKGLTPFFPSVPGNSSRIQTGTPSSEGGEVFFFVRLVALPAVLRGATVLRLIP